MWRNKKDAHKGVQVMTSSHPESLGIGCQRGVADGIVEREKRRCV